MFYRVWAFTVAISVMQILIHCALCERGNALCILWWTALRFWRDLIPEGRCGACYLRRSSHSCLRKWELQSVTLRYSMMHGRPEWSISLLMTSSRCGELSNRGRLKTHKTRGSSRSSCLGLGAGAEGRRAPVQWGARDENLRSSLVYMLVARYLATTDYLMSIHDSIGLEWIFWVI